MMINAGNVASIYSFSLLVVIAVPAALDIASVQIGTALVAALVPITTTPFDISFAKSTPALFAIPFASAVQDRTVVLAIVIMIDGTQWWR